MLQALHKVVYDEFCCFCVNSMEGFFRLVFKGIAILESGTRENVVSFGELVYFLESVDTI